jgi:hypothetical protein
MKNELKTKFPTGKEIAQSGQPAYVTRHHGAAFRYRDLW